MSKVIIVMTRPISESVTPTYDTTSKAIVCSSVKMIGLSTREEISYTVDGTYNIDTNYCVTFKQFLRSLCVSELTYHKASKVGQMSTFTQYFSRIIWIENCFTATWIPVNCIDRGIILNCTYCQPNKRLTYGKIIEHTSSVGDILKRKNTC